MKKRNMPNPICRKCDLYYITHDKNAPYGCRGYEFKTSKLPSQAILDASGLPCLMFKPKTYAVNKTQ